MKNLTYHLLIVLTILTTACSKDDLNSDVNNTVYGADPENLDASGLPERLFDAKLPVMPNTLEYTIDLTQWDIPSNGNTS